MSWQSSSAGTAGDVAADIEKKMAPTSYDDHLGGAVKLAIAAVARAVANRSPNTVLMFETGGHVDSSTAYGTVSFKTYTPARVTVEAAKSEDAGAVGTSLGPSA